MGFSESTWKAPSTICLSPVRIPVTPPDRIFVGLEFGGTRRPFFGRTPRESIDLLLNIYGIREETR